MKTSFLSILTSFLLVLGAYAQDITGAWNGTLPVSDAVKLRLVIHIEKTENGYKSTLDSPDQGAKGIPVSQTTFENQTLQIAITAARIEYIGVLKGDKFVGTFKQNGRDFPMELSKGNIAVEIPKRPQEPQKPYPYYTEDVIFDNPKARIKLAGTLSLPQKEGVYPAVILISGSGPQNRDEELLGHKPFLVISDYLTRNGIAVLRFDDRGVGQSTGIFKTATSQDHASDVASAVAYLRTRKEIKQIGLMGHSEGGLIAPMVAAPDKNIAFIVLLAGTGIRGDQLLLLQQELIARAGGASEQEITQTIEANRGAFDIIIKNEDDERIKKDLTDYMTHWLKANPTVKPKEVNDEQFVEAQVKQTMGPWPWMKFFIKYDPTPTLESVQCPVLALNGEKDLQVPAQVNLSAIEKALKKGKNKDVTTKAYKDLNHLFQEAKTGSPAEYPTIQQTFSPQVMEDCVRWINARVNK